MSGHTPGPWLIDYAQTGVRWPVIYVRDEAWDGGKREIAEITNCVAKRDRAERWRPTPDAGEAEANARLIAATPEFKEAALAALKYDEAIQRAAAQGKPWAQEPDEELDALYADWIDKSRAALAKIEPPPGEFHADVEIPEKS